MRMRQSMSQMRAGVVGRGSCWIASAAKSFGEVPSSARASAAAPRSSAARNCVSCCFRPRYCSRSSS